MSGQFYARWAPPAKSATRRTPSPTAHSPTPQTKRASETPDTTERKKHKDKSKQKSIEASSKVLGSPQDERSHTSNHTIDEYGEPRKKSKKRKRESLVDNQPEAQDEAIPKKHRTILTKFERSSERAEAVRAAAESDLEEEHQEEMPAKKLHDLTPLPQPAPVPEAPFKPTFSTLPTWLTKPVTVASSKTVPFNELGVHHTFLRNLEKQGFKDALAVQSVLLPMLHPGLEQHLGDVCVSARTGSGKTLAYLLPIIESLSDQAVTTLSAIVVVPTRQLVDQALKVAEDLCVGTKLKVGTALGSVPFATEQKQLVKLRPQYDPRRAKELQNKASQQLATGILERRGILNDLATMPKDHIPQYDSGVDILICTPGRLVEHIGSTTGFLLRSVRWLVIDEADQLLTQDFQGWASILIDALHGETPEDLMNAQERLRNKRQGSFWSIGLPTQRQITKIVLSATMKKDLTKLGALRFRRPKLVVVEDEIDEPPAVLDGDVFELPTTLEEFAVSVASGSNKPLYLLYLLLRVIFKFEGAKIAGSDSSTDSETDASNSHVSAEDSQVQNGIIGTFEGHEGRVLLFAKSNENASRLSHLLSAIEPSLAPFIKTMDPSATSKQSQRVLKAFAAGKIKILIASDAASRGLDIPDITHVINYDIPSSITSYVHRVGRTARASKEGQAWTMLTNTEAGWFWNQIAKGGSVKRGNKKVSRIEFKQRDVMWNRRRTYQDALMQLQGAVEGIEGAAD